MTALCLNLGRPTGIHGDLANIAVSVLVELQRCRISRLVILSCHFTPRIVRRQCRWKLFNFSSCLW